MSFFKLELQLRLRHLNEWLYPLVFFIFILSVFPLAFSPDLLFLQTYLAGCVWLAVLFSTILGIQTIFISDREDAHLEQLFMSAQTRTVLITLKLMAYWCATSLPLIVLTPLITTLYQLPIHVGFVLTLTLFFGSPILMLIAAFAMSMTLSLKQQGVLLSLIMLPLIMPIIIFGVTITQQAAAHFRVSGPVALLAGLGLLAITLLPFVITTLLRMSVDE